MKTRMTFVVENLDTVEQSARELLSHIEAIRKLQDKLGPYHSVEMAIRLEKGTEEQ